MRLPQELKKISYRIMEMRALGMNCKIHCTYVLSYLKVEVNSPADLAGLMPEKDYLLGTAEKVNNM